MLNAKVISAIVCVRLVKFRNIFEIYSALYIYIYIYIWGLADNVIFS